MNQNILIVGFFPTKDMQTPPPSVLLPFKWKMRINRVKNQFFNWPCPKEGYADTSPPSEMVHISWEIQNRLNPKIQLWWWKEIRFIFRVMVKFIENWPFSVKASHQIFFSPWANFFFLKWPNLHERYGICWNDWKIYFVIKNQLILMHVTSCM